MAGLIFLTGASGFVGCATALEALKAGYRLRLSVRKEAQIDRIKSVLSSYLGQLDFVVLPDITKPSAFAGHLDGVDYALHIASPLPTGTNKDDYFPGAVDGTIAILSEAAKVSSIKRVVITSSIASLMPLGGPPSDHPVSEHVETWNTTISADLPIFDSSANPHPMLLYQASKLLALQAAESFVSTHNPRFDIVTIHPSFVCGPNILQSSAADAGGSSGMLFRAIMAGEASAHPSVLTLVHIQDVAMAHVRALSPDVPAGRYLTSSPGGTTWSDIVDILEEKFPHVAWRLKRDAEGQGWAVDVGKAKQVLGFTPRGLSSIVSDTVAFYQSLP
jgi:nucleoside-diphosphate-sugar epimerase